MTTNQSISTRDLIKMLCKRKVNEDLEVFTGSANQGNVSASMTAMNPEYGPELNFKINREHDIFPDPTEEILLQEFLEKLFHDVIQEEENNANETTEHKEDTCPLTTPVDQDQGSDVTHEEDKNGNHSDVSTSGAYQENDHQEKIINCEGDQILTDLSHPKMIINKEEETEAREKGFHTEKINELVHATMDFYLRNLPERYTYSDDECISLDHFDVEISKKSGVITITVDYNLYDSFQDATYSAKKCEVNMFNIVARSMLSDYACRHCEHGHDFENIVDQYFKDFCDHLLHVEFPVPTNLWDTNCSCFHKPHLEN